MSLVHVCAMWTYAVVQVTGIYSAGRWMLEIKLGHILQDSLSCHLYSLLHPHSPPTSVLSWLEDVDSGTVIQAPKDSSLHSPWGKGSQTRTLAQGGSLNVSWTWTQQVPSVGWRDNGWLMTYDDLPRKERRHMSQATVMSKGEGLHTSFLPLLTFSSCFHPVFFTLFLSSP